MQCFWMGQDTLKVPMHLFRLNRDKLCTLLKANTNVPEGAVVLLEGGKQLMRYCSDFDILFRQVSRVAT